MQTVIVSVPSNYAQYGGTDGRYVAFQQLPVALASNAYLGLSISRKHMLWQVLVLVTGPLAQLQSSLIYFRRLVPGWTGRDEVNGTGTSGGLSR